MRERGEERKRCTHRKVELVGCRRVDQSRSYCRSHGPRPVLHPQKGNRNSTKDIYHWSVINRHQRPYCLRHFFHWVLGADLGSICLDFGV